MYKQTAKTTNIWGRVMSFIAMAFFGMLPLGSLLIGAVSQKIGAPPTMLCQGITAILIAALFAKLLPKVQPAISEKAPLR